MARGIALSPLVSGVVTPAPDGTYPNQNTAEGDFSLQTHVWRVETASLGLTVQAIVLGCWSSLNNPAQFDG